MTRRAATLIETLVVLGVVAILAAILVPVLQSVLRSRATTLDLSNMRQTMIDFNVFAASNAGAIANAGAPFEAGTEWYYGRHWRSDQGWFSYLGQSAGWPRVLARQMEAGRHWHTADEDWAVSETDMQSLSIELRPDLFAGWPSDFSLGDTLLLKPDGFRYPRATDDRRNAVPLLAARLRMHDITDPSRKGFLRRTNWDGPARGVERIAFADGSTSDRRAADALPTAVHPTSVDPLRRGAPVHTTLEGCRGRDF